MIEEMDMGGKPSKGTKRDKRLKENTPTQAVKAPKARIKTKKF